jgi:hypothetical protein
MQSVGQVQSFAENNPGRGEVGRGSYLDRPAVRGGVCGELIILTEGRSAVQTCGTVDAGARDQRLVQRADRRAGRDETAQPKA